MSKVVKNYQELAMLMGFSFNQRSKILYGYKDGFSIVVNAPNYNEPYRFAVSVSAKPSADGLTSQEIRQFKTENPGIDLEQKHNQMMMVLDREDNQMQLYKKLHKSINALISFLRLKGFAPCCMSCGQNVKTSVYSVGASYNDAYLSMCPACINKLKIKIAYDNSQKHENIIGGIVGALIGSVIGMILILLCARIRVLPMLLGFITSICTFKGYELLGKKMTKKGLIISMFLVLMTTYISNRLDWAMLAATQLETDIVTAFRLVPYLLKEGLIDTFTFVFNLLALSVSTIGGAVFIIVSELNEGKIIKISP